MMDKLKLDVVEARILTGTEDLEKAAIIVERGLPGNHDNALPGRSWRG